MDELLGALPIAAIYIGFVFALIAAVFAAILYVLAAIYTSIAYVSIVFFAIGDTMLSAHRLAEIPPSALWAAWGAFFGAVWGLYTGMPRWGFAKWRALLPIGVVTALAATALPTLTEVGHLIGADTRPTLRVTPAEGTDTHPILIGRLPAEWQGTAHPRDGRESYRMTMKIIRHDGTCNFKAILHMRSTSGCQSAQLMSGSVDPISGLLAFGSMRILSADCAWTRDSFTGRLSGGGRAGALTMAADPAMYAGVWDRWELSPSDKAAGRRNVRDDHSVEEKVVATIRVFEEASRAHDTVRFMSRVSPNNPARRGIREAIANHFSQGHTFDYSITTIDMRDSLVTASLRLTVRTPAGRTSEYRGSYLFRLRGGVYLLAGPLI